VRSVSCSGKNYVVSVTELKTASAPAESPQSPTSPNGAGGSGPSIVAGSDAADTRVWLDDDATDVCVSQQRGETETIARDSRRATDCCCAEIQLHTARS
jgi:hypothetical protein